MNQYLVQATVSYTHEELNLFKRNPISSDTLPGSKINLLDRIEEGEQGEDCWEVWNIVQEYGLGLGLKVGLQGPGDIRSAVLNSVLDNPHNFTDEKSNMIYLPGLPSKKEVPDDNTSLFHRNEKGEVVFTDEQADRASDFIASSNMEERVKAALQKKRFVLPQEIASAQSFFCNESVYGSVNILWVCGVVKLDGSGQAAMGASQKFDAWPSAKAKI